MLNILYQFNEKYVPYAGTSIISLLENNRDIDEIHFYLLGEKVSKASQRQLQELIIAYGRGVEFIDASDVVEHMKKMGINDYRGSYATNIKMFVTSFIPNTVKQLLYIDSDTLVVGALNKLEKYPMDGCPIAMVQDSVCAWHKREMGFAFDEPYFNGGVILYDMETWRELDCMNRIMDHIIHDRCHYMAPDQDLMNLVLKGQIKDLTPAYNFQPLHRVYPYGLYYAMFATGSYYSKEQLEQALEEPAILHCFRYLGQFPWHKDSLHPDAELFLEYLEKTPWRSLVLEETEQNDFVFRFERWMYRVMPKWMFIIVFKVCYEAFMWKSNHDAKRHKNNARM